MNEYRSVTGKDWAITLGLILAYLIAIFVAAIALPGLGGLLAGVGGLFLLVRWHNSQFAYRCRSCGSAFEISSLRNFISPHGVNLRGKGWKLLKCPACGKWNRAEMIKKPASV